MALEDVDGDIDDIFDTETDFNVNDEFFPVPDDEECSESLNEEDSRQQRSTIATWLAKSYADLRERLASEMRRNLSGMPSCYDHHTFMDGSPFPFFATQKKFALEPDDLYQPTYFIWLPHVLLERKTGIPCPNCLAAARVNDSGKPILLRAWGFPRTSRRVVDVDRCIQIVGYRYSCGHSECKKTYTSWSPALLSVLPRALSLQFPFHLTHRNGLSDQLVGMLRNSFHHGIGPVPFANAIRINHIRRYEHLHLQYLELIYARKQSAFAGFLPRFKPFGEFGNRDGYAGFIPSPRYFRNFYVRYISSHSHEMDQYTAMLSSELLQIDHSFKVCSLTNFIDETFSYDNLGTETCCEA
jgi:hypothetical protein